MMTDMTRREFLGKASAAGAMAAFGGCAGVDGTARGAECFERKTTCDWKATVTKQDDRWEAILRIGYDPKKIAPDGTVRLLLSHIGDGELVTWKGGRPHRPAMFIKAKLVR